MSDTPRNIWVLGESVQDITVSVDLEALRSEHGKVSDIRLEDTPMIRKGPVLKTSVGGGGSFLQQVIRHHAGGSIGVVLNRHPLAGWIA